MPGPFTSDIRLTWNANTETDLAGYKIYAGRATGDYSHSGSPKNVGNVTTATYTIDDAGAWYFAVTAYDSSNNESDFSTEVSRSYVLAGNF